MPVMDSITRERASMPLERAVSIIWVIFMNLLAAPLYIGATDSLLQTIAPLSDVASLFALSIWLPIIYSWKRSWRVGVAVQLFVLAASVAWLAFMRPQTFHDIRQYLTPLLLITVGGAIFVTVIVVALAYLRPRKR
jgi:hypothetical protein